MARTRTRYQAYSRHSSRSLQTSRQGQLRVTTQVQIPADLVNQVGLFLQDEHLLQKNSKTEYL